MSRPMGVTLLAIAAGVAGIFQVWRILVFLGIASFNFIGRTVSFTEPQWGQALWALILAGIWFWIAAGFWNVRSYAWAFGIFISLFTLIFGFFAILGSTTFEEEFVPMLIAFLIFFYLNYPGVRSHFEEAELDRLTPDRQAAMAQVQQANAAAAQAMASPAPTDSASRTS